MTAVSASVVEIPNGFPGGPPPFPFLTFEQALRRADERPEFLVPGLVASSLTLFIGEPEAGKSSLAGALVHSVLMGEPFLGRKLTRPIRRVYVLTTEVDGPDEISRRLREQGVDHAAGLWIVPLFGVTAEGWRELAATIQPDLATLVVVDNLNGVVPEGSINTDDTVRQVGAGLRLFTDAGAPVVLLHHTSDKAGANGHGKSSLPMGHTSINAMGRWTVFVGKGKGDALKLKCHGNAAAAEEITLARDPGRGALALTVTSETSAAALAAREHNRDQVQAQRLVGAARWAVENHADAPSALALGQLLAKEFPWLSAAADPGRQVGKDISGGTRKIGAYLHRVNGAWELTGCGT